ncbi:iron-containing alcohol dehydrogenase [Virgibacillus salexigens]|uniref:iron-containing alcohol dehydrogenase n=1 Tax=Virgibacillus TaxID=84406 RepID=UPI00136FDEC6|nr:MULTISPECIES: iron-containing alcohol dehydrogenase [Virgibacillus]MYL42627.1 iron-containing alcohol dehydrogenase [Virgibacillus massiliensis]
MDMRAVFRMPRTIHYGRSALERIGEETAHYGSKALIISDEVMSSLGYISNVRDYLATAKVESVTYLGVASEPTDVFVTEALELMEEKSCDVIISIGGGSCIDTAKAVSVLAVNGGYIGDYRNRNKTITKAPIAHIAIPTTAGTGSEATDATVITNKANDVKMMIKQPAFMPEVAIVDPLLTISSPKHVTAATGIDALSHAIEAYISRQSQPMTDTLALSAMKLIVDHIEAAYEHGENLDARGAMALGALQAGIAFTNASVCLVHGMSRPIGALFHVPHGYSNAMLLPAVLEFSQEHCRERLADLGRFFVPTKEKVDNQTAADIAVNEVKRLCKELQIPNLRGWGIDERSYESVIKKMALDALDSGSPANNPKVPTRLEIESLYRICFDYNYSTDNVMK